VLAKSQLIIPVMEPVLGSTRIFEVWRSVCARKKIPVSLPT
jgi:hypothetical protein